MFAKCSPSAALEKKKKMQSTNEEIAYSTLTPGSRSWHHSGVPSFFAGSEEQHHRMSPVLHKLQIWTPNTNFWFTLYGDFLIPDSTTDSTYEMRNG